MDTVTKNNSQEPFWPFDALPDEVRKWLKSEAVEGIVQELNRKFGFIDTPQERAIGYTSTWVTLGYIKPEEFAQTLIQDFGIEAKMAQQVATVVKERIFRPIRMGMKNRLYIDVDRLDEMPQIPKPSLQPAPAQNTVNLRERGAQTTQMEKRITPRVEKQASRTMPEETKKPAGPHAQENNPERPFHLTEQSPDPQDNQQQ